MPKQKTGFRFGLKLMIAVVTLAAIMFAIFAHPFHVARRQNRIIAKIADFGGSSESAMPIYPNGFRYAVASWFYSNLPAEMTVDLANSSVTDDDLKDILQLQQIRKLNLSGTGITDEGLQHIAAASLPRLRKLGLAETEVTDDGIRLLAGFETLGSLSTHGTEVSYQALRKLDGTLPHAHFAEERAYGELKNTGMQIVDIDRHVNGTLLGLPDSFQAGIEIHDVIVGMNRQLHVTDKMIRDLCHLDSLKELHFHGVTLGPKGFESIDLLESLEVLELYRFDLKDKDIPHFVRLKTLKQIELYGCKELTGTTLTSLAKLPTLERLKIHECRAIPKETLIELKTLLPNCKCEFQMLR